MVVLTMPRADPPFVARLRGEAPWPILTHIAAGLVALAIGPWQFNRRLRSRALTLHRWMGRVYVAAVMAAGIAGLVLAIGAQEGIVTHAGFGLLAVAWLASTTRAYLVIRAGDDVRHRQWMIRSFSLTFAAVTLRVLLPLELASGVSFSVAYQVVSWACWVPNLLVAEWLLRADRGRRRATVAAAVLALALAVVARPTAAQDAPRWPDSFTSRLEALALVQTLNGNLLASRSATATLETWCRDHHLAEPAQIVADAVPGTAVAPTAEQLQRLGVSQAGEVKYRHVRLRCGTHVLSEADNWYVPARLTVEMNRTLETTDAPFGRVVAPLQPYRRTFAVTMVWSPLPAGWESGAAVDATAVAPLEVPAVLFEHRAVLYTSENRPFSEVRELYQRGALAFLVTHGSRSR